MFNLLSHLSCIIIGECRPEILSDYLREERICSRQSPVEQVPMAMPAVRSTLDHGHTMVYGPHHLRKRLGGVIVLFLSCNGNRGPELLPLPPPGENRR